jgi:hypothetical protein
MDQTTTVLVIVAIVLVLAIALIVALSRRSRLHALPPESRDRYARSWQNVETRFIDDPHGAVQEADKLAVMMLGERGATIHDDRKVPDELRQARDAATSDEGREGTEGMRKAMVHYRRLVEDGVGDDMKKRREESARREVAS